MGTRAAAFTAKIKNLQDYYLRLLHGIPLPSELDIACTLKYFSLTLMGVLKDVPEAPLEMLRRPDQDSTRLALYPSLDYTGLYRALVQLFDIVPLLQYGVHGFGQSLLHTMSCLVPFLEHSLIDSLPYLVASSLATFPVSLHRDIVNTLCHYLLPFTLSKYRDIVNTLCHYLLPFTLSPDVENYTSSSVTAIVMVVFQYTDMTALHCQLLETVMSRRRMVIRDLFCIIAHGTVSARLPAAHLLFHYWPALNPTSADRRNNLLKFTGLDAEDIGWEPHQCERDNCPSNENNEAIQLCLDHNVAVLQGSEYPPPLYLCQHCSQDIRASNSQISMFEILLPMQHMSTTCENKNCRSSDKLAMCTCFNIECASYNGNRPIRYCAQCDSIRHNNRRGGDHVVQYRIGSPWKMAPDVSRYMVEAVVSLLKEAQPLADSRRSREQERHTRAGLLDDALQPEGPSLEERRSLSRYGVWLLVNLCTPDRTTSEQTLARLLAALFNWFEATAYLGDDQTGGALELLKSEYIHSWLQGTLADHFKTFASCLLPRPPEYARVGGHWDGLVSKTQHIQEGFHRLFCLVPYDIISAELWNHIMPNWLEAILQDVPEDELPELKIILSKLLDPDMSPLGFDADQMYQFVSVRCHSSAPRVQEQALTWLQVLSMVNIAIPLPILHKMLRTGVRCLQTSKDGVGSRKVSSIRSQINSDLGPVVQSESRAASPLSGEDCMPEEEAPVSAVDTADLVVPCYLLMLDVLLKQMEIQDVARNQGLQSNQSQQAVTLLKAMLSSPTDGKHSCDPGDSPTLETYRENSKDEPVRVEQCDACEALLELYQLAGELLGYICPEETVKSVEISEEVTAETVLDSPPAPHHHTEEPAPHGQEKPPPPVLHEHIISMDGLQQHVIQPSQVMMATEEVTEMDVAASMPAERVVRAVAKAVTISEDDIAVAKVKVCAARLVGENDQPLLVPTIEEGDNFWTTSHGRFRFTVDELPPELQLLYGLLNRMKESEDQDVTSHLLACLRLLVLHADCLQRAARDHRGFHIWCQENLVIKQLWDLLLAEYSQIPEIAVPVLLHAITLPCGADVFWQIVGTEFQSDDWKVRFTAVERATVLARFLDPAVVRQSGPALQPSLAHVFSYLIHAVDDLSAAVAQKVQLYMETIPDGGIRTICMCLEAQFDTVIVDRPLVLKTVLQLFHLLPARGILSWEFFNSRFDSLVLETQIRLERRGDIPLTKDLKADGGAASEAYIRRLTRAHEALTAAASGPGAQRRTLNSSIGTKWPYKRAMSAPAVVPRATADKNDILKHSYPRQASAPALNRKASRFGISQMNHAPENSKSSAAAGVGWDSLPLVYRSLDGEQGDRETIHLLVDLLMKYMGRPDQLPPGDDKQQCRHQQSALRHLAMTLGFNQTDKTFFMSPARLRSKASFNAFLSQLTHVLDYNFPLGGALVPLCLPVLLYAAAPSRQAAMAPGRPSYSLWCLEERQRNDWLAALLTVLYKKARCSDSFQYQYGDPALSAPLLALCQIVLNTLHLCRPPAETPSAAAAAAAAATPLSRIGSLQPGGVGGSPPGPADQTPPVTPRPTLAPELVPPPPPPPPPSGPPAFSVGGEDWRRGRSDPNACYGSDDNDIEPELEAIPESPKTPSSHQSFCDSLVDLDQLEEMAPVQAVQPVRVSSSLSGLGMAEMAQSVCVTNQLASVTPQVACAVSSELVSASVTHPGEFVTASVAHPGELVTASVTHPGELVTASVAHPGELVTASVAHSGELVTASVAHPGELVTASMAAQEMVTVVQPTEIVCHQVHAAAEYSVMEETDELEMYRPTVMAAVSQPPIATAAPASGRQGTALFTHSVSLDVQASPAEAWQPPRAQSLAVPRGGEAPAVNGAASGTERSLLERLSLVFSKQESHAPGSAGRLMLHLGSEGRGGHTRDVTGGETLANQSSASTEDDAATPGDEPAVHRAYIKQPKAKKLGLSPVEQAAAESRTNRWARRDKQGGGDEKPIPSIKQCNLRVGHDCVLERCPDCGQVREDYTEEELGLCVVVLATFVHREPSLAACLLPDMLRAVSGLAARQRYPWQSESSYSLPGSVNSVCRQFLRCVLHRLAAHNMFFKLFQADMDVDSTHAFFRTLAQALADFAELNTAAPLHHLLEYLNRQRSAPCLDELPTILYNMSVYLECVPLEAGGSLYGPLVPLLDALLHRLLPCLAALPELDSLMAIMCSVLKIPNVNMYKTVLEPFSKIVSLVVQTRPIDYRRLVELCHLCNRVFSREREKQQLSRVVVFELVQALKFKSSPPDTNLLLLVHFVVQDAGGTMAPSTVMDMVPDLGTDTAGATGAAECMRQHLNDALDFLADVHTLTKIKSNCTGPLRGLNEDTMGGVLKAGVAQFVALEISRGNSRENRAISRYLPWLYNPPSPVQQGPKEFIDCVSHIRLLSWLLLGAMTHATVLGPQATVTCQPVPLDASCHIADHIQVILAGFAEQSKASVLHMSSLFHAFILCQLWTMYLEVVSAGQTPPGHEQHAAALAILADFWAKVTPGILQLVSHSRVLGEMVNLHFLSLMEALAECNASTLARLLPVWTQVFYAYNEQLPGHLSVRLQSCQSQPAGHSCLLQQSPPAAAHGSGQLHGGGSSHQAGGAGHTGSSTRPDGAPAQPAGHSSHQLLLSWIQRLQFKMGQIELQSSAAAQFYTV